MLRNAIFSRRVAGKYPYTALPAPQRKPSCRAKRAAQPRKTGRFAMQNLPFHIAKSAKQPIRWQSATCKPCHNHGAERKNRYTKQGRYHYY